jgi:SAM-dependent methyltransferase
MKNEFEKALDFLKEKLQSSSDHELIFVNIPADRLFEKYLFDFPFKNKIEYIPYELNKSFADILGFKNATIESIDLSNDKTDIILSIAALHHFNQDERLTFYKECKRILKPDGVLLIGDVLKGSKQDKWLNEYVNEYNSNGHNGIFFTEDEKFILEKVGFQVETELVEYTWNFDSIESMCEYCINLFGLDKISSDDFILQGIEKYLDYSVNDDLTCQFSWGLIYFKSINSQV